MYKNGKIYMIANLEQTERYYGSTVQPLSKRFSSHKGNYKWNNNGSGGRCMSFALFDKYGLENCNIFFS